MRATYMYFHTWEGFCMCVWNDTFPTLIFRTHSREWVYPLPWLDLVWLTDSQELSHPQLVFPLFIFLTHDTHLQQHFLVLWLIFPVLMQYRGCEAKSSKDFYAAFRTYIGLVEYSPAHAHAEVEMCTYKYKKNTDTKTCTHATHFMFSMIFTMTGLYALDFLWTEKQIETSVHELMTSIILLVTCVLMLAGPPGLL